MTETADTTIQVFQSDTGKVHRPQQYEWGMGAMCSDRFMPGRLLSAPVRQIDCQHCLDWNTPSPYEVRLPDQRYKVGYRVVHTNVVTREYAETLAGALGERAYVVEIPR